MNNQFNRMSKLAGLITENMDETTGAWGGPSRGVETTTLKFNGNKASDLYNAIKNKNHVRVLVPNKGSVTVDIKDLEANPEDDSFTGYTADGSDYGMYIKDIKGISYDAEGVAESKKMTKSSLKAQIKEMILAEVAGGKDEYSNMSDSELIKLANHAGVEETVVIDGEGGLANRDEVIANLKEVGALDEVDTRELDSYDQADPIQQLYKKHSATENIELKSEAKKKKKMDQDVPETDETSEETPDMDSEMPLDGDVASEPTHTDIQKELNDALEAAKAKGDEKLIRIIGNALTYFTRSQVADQEGTVSEEKLEGLSEDFIRNWQKVAGIIK